MMPLSLDLPKRRQDGRSAKRCYRDMPEGRKKVLFHTPQDFDGMALAPDLDLFGVPIPGDHLKGIRIFSRLSLGICLLLLSLLPGVYPFCK